MRLCAGILAAALFVGCASDVYLDDDYLGASDAGFTDLTGQFEDDDPDEERVIVVADLEDAPERVRRDIGAFLKHHPDGTRVKVTLRTFFDFGHSTSTNTMQPYVYSIVPVDAEGNKDGVEEVREPRGSAPVRTIPYEAGLRQGIEKVYRTLGGTRYLAVEVPWEKGVVSGVRRTRHSNGRARTETQYVDGKATGTTKSYSADGKLAREGTMLFGVPHGVRKDYYPDTGQLKRVVPYESGVVNGVVREYYRDGTLKREMPFARDCLDGVESQYGGKGELVRERTWNDGVLVSEREFGRRSAD